MAVNDYVFETRWRMKATPEEVSAVLGKPLDLPRWWPEVYLRVQEEDSGVFVLHTKGWLPYTLDWRFQRTDSREPYGFTIRAWGDLEGTGVWTFERDGDHTDIRYIWTIRASKPLLRYLSFLLKPVFAANHRWAMARGEIGLRKELERRSGNIGGVYPSR